MASATGYGARLNLVFDGSDDKFELWLVKFKAHLRLQKLLNIVTEERGTDAKFADKNAQVFAELVTFLDDKSLSLVMRDAADDGKKALGILEEHYLGKSKPRIISLYTELTTLAKGTDESVTDYFLRAEKAATALKNAGEVISDGLLIAMSLKGLPQTYSAFTTVITQKDDMTFVQFKAALKSYEETEKSRQSNSSSSVMSSAVKPIKCYLCGKEGHKKPECPNKSSQFQ